MSRMFVGAGRPFGLSVAVAVGDLFAHPTQSAGALDPAIYDGHDTSFSDDGAGSITQTEDYGLGVHVIAPLAVADAEVRIQANITNVSGDIYNGSDVSLYLRSDTGARFGSYNSADTALGYSAGIDSGGNMWITSNTTRLTQSFNHSFTGKLVELRFKAAGSSLTFEAIDTANSTTIATLTATDATHTGSTSATRHIGFAMRGSVATRYVQTFRAIAA